MLLVVIMPWRRKQGISDPSKANKSKLVVAATAATHQWETPLVCFLRKSTNNVVQNRKTKTLWATCCFSLKTWNPSAIEGKQILCKGSPLCVQWTSSHSRAQVTRHQKDLRERTSGLWCKKVNKVKRKEINGWLAAQVRHTIFLNKLWKRCVGIPWITVSGDKV